MYPKLYDYAIIGAGAAGLQLALKMAKDSFFNDKDILILEKDKKNTNDHTWSFWEMGTSDWDRLAVMIWKEGLFIGNHTVKLSFSPYCYKTIRSDDLYKYAKTNILGNKNFTWIEDQIFDVRNGNIQGEAGQYRSKYVFDSRISPFFRKTADQYDGVVQHFKGWVIETARDAFDPSVFTMMDYRLQWKNNAGFTYILPFSPTQGIDRVYAFQSGTFIRPGIRSNVGAVH